MSTQTTNPLMKMFIGKTAIFLVFVVAIFALTQMVSCSPKAQDDTTTIYVVRHAEKLTGPDVGRDPELSDTGKERANVLAQLLKDKNITHIHSSNYIRTRNTGAPLAEIMGIKIELYDPRDLAGLAKNIKAQSTDGAHHLVVGHSNTSAETVLALGGEISGKPIYEPTEYDRLYKVEIFDNAVHTKLTRYGVRYTEK